MDEFNSKQMPESISICLIFLKQLIVVIFGIIITSLVFVVEKLGPVFQMTTTISGIPSGALLGLFTTGMLCRRINTKVIRFVLKRVQSAEREIKNHFFR